MLLSRFCRLGRIDGAHPHWSRVVRYLAKTAVADTRRSLLFTAEAIRCRQYADALLMLTMRQEGGVELVCLECDGRFVSPTSVGFEGAGALLLLHVGLDTVSGSLRSIETATLHVSPVFRFDVFERASDPRESVKCQGSSSPCAVCTVANAGVERTFAPSQSFH